MAGSGFQLELTLSLIDTPMKIRSKRCVSVMGSQKKKRKGLSFSVVLRRVLQWILWSVVLSVFFYL